MGNSSFFHKQVAICKKEQEETFEPNAMFGTCLDSDLNKQLKRYVCDNKGNLPIDWISSDSKTYFNSLNVIRLLSYVVWIQTEEFVGEIM